MPEDSNELPDPVPTNHGQFEGPATKNDYLEAQEMSPTDTAQLRFQERQTREALAQSESRKYDEVTKLSLTDVFTQEAREKLSRLNSSERSNRPNTALIVQVDVKGLKDVNDGVGGHEAGNILLKNVADLLKSLARLEDGDLAGRLGGDEFGLVIFFNSHEIT